MQNFLTHHRDSDFVHGNLAGDDQLISNLSVKWMFLHIACSYILNYFSLPLPSS